MSALRRHFDLAWHFFENVRSLVQSIDHDWSIEPRVIVILKGAFRTKDLKTDQE
jgi:hypothetical protein